jgi:hypothetical protein
MEMPVTEVPVNVATLQDCSERVSVSPTPTDCTTEQVPVVLNTVVALAGVAMAIREASGTTVKAMALDLL